MKRLPRESIASHNADEGPLVAAGQQGGQREGIGAVPGGAMLGGGLVRAAGHGDLGARRRPRALAERTWQGARCSMIAETSSLLIETVVSSTVAAYQLSRIAAVTPITTQCRFALLRSNWLKELRGRCWSGQQLEQASCIAGRVSAVPRHRGAADIRGRLRQRRRQGRHAALRQQLHGDREAALRSVVGRHPGAAPPAAAGRRARHC